MNNKYKREHKHQFDQWRVQELPPLTKNTPMWVLVQGQQVTGTFRHAADIPISYVMDTSSGHLRRNH